MATATGSAITRAPRPSSLADVLDLILDKGLVVDAYVRVSALGIEVLTIDARIVIASVDTYLHYAEAVNRLDLTQTETPGIQGLAHDLTESGARGKVGGAIEGAKEALGVGGNGRGSERGARSSRRRGG
jgi:gas vesicle structural protein